MAEPNIDQQTRGSIFAFLHTCGLASSEKRPQDFLYRTLHDKTRLYRNAEAEDIRVSPERRIENLNQIVIPLNLAAKARLIESSAPKGRKSGIEQSFSECAIELFPLGQALHRIHTGIVTMGVAYDGRGGLNAQSMDSQGQFLITSGLDMYKKILPKDRQVTLQVMEDAGFMTPEAAALLRPPARKPRKPGQDPNPAK
ncbi:MAG: hypothetical protein WDO70_01025 [Alphaproteobacteria bacterium]